MNKEQVKDIMKVAMELTPGDSMAIEVPSRGQGLSLRTMFYRERMEFLKRGMAMNVSLSSIVQREEDGQWLAYFTYEEPPKIVVYKADGSSSQVELEEKAPSIPEEKIAKDVIEILKKHRARKEEGNDK